MSSSEIRTAGSLFAGIGGFDVALEEAGISVRWQVEIDRFARKVLEAHFPAARRYGDVREVRGSDLEPVDLISGGTPCQDLSVAGRRAGLGGEQSQLFWEFARIVDEVAPPWILFENVPDLLTSPPKQRGEDFSLVLWGLTGYHPEVPKGGWRRAGFCRGPKRDVAWRVLDAQYFGLAQRRPRLFLVGGPGKGARALEALLEPDCLPGDPPPRREAEEAVAHTLTSGSRSRGRSGTSGRRGEDDYNLVPEVAGTLGGTKRRGGWGWELDSTGAFVPEVSPALSASGSRHGYNWPGADAYVVTQALTQGYGRGGADDTKGQGGFLVAQCHGTNVGPLGTLRSGNGGVTGGVPFVFPDLRRHDENHRGLARDKPVITTTNVDLLFDGRASVRRLTPVETERLQGFKDGWTDVASGPKGYTPDTPRYRTVGNAAPPPVVLWILRRIMAVEARHSVALTEGG